MTTVLVVGAAGLLGREVVRALRARAFDVVESGRARAPGRLRFDAETDAPEVLFSRGVDAVVNCAAALASEIDEGDPGTVRRAEAVNAVFPHALAAAADAHSARLIHVSTDAVYCADAGRCYEDDDRYADDVYGSTKRRGEPAVENAVSLRCSFVGNDPQRKRGLVEWLRAQPAGAAVNGYVDQAWNGLASGQVAAVCAALADPGRFAEARAEGPVHHLFEDPPLSKHELVELCVRALALPLTVVPRESGRPSDRVLGTRYAALAECLQCVKPRAEMLAALSEGGDDADA